MNQEPGASRARLSGRLQRTAIRLARLLTLLWLGWLLALSSQPVVAQVPSPTAPLTLDEYAARLRKAQDRLSADSSAEGMERAQRGLAGIAKVRLRSGVEISVAPLLGEPGSALSSTAARARLNAALDQLAASGADDTADRLAALATVLERPEFNVQPSWWDQFLRWLEQLLRRLAPDTAPSSSGVAGVATGAEWLGWLLIGLGAAALVWLLTYWLRGFLRSFAANAEVAQEPPDSGLPATPSAARRHAARDADRGDFRSAVRHLYLAALLTLEEHNLVVRDRSLTNREVLTRVPATHPVRPVLEPVVNTFDDVWYGVHEPNVATYERYSQAIDDLTSLAQEPERAGGEAGRS